MNTANMLDIGLRGYRGRWGTYIAMKSHHSRLIYRRRGRSWLTRRVGRDKRKKTGKVAKGSRHGAPRRYLPRNWWPWCSVPPGLELCFSNYRGYMSVYHERSMRIMPLSRPLHALSVHFRWFLIRWILWLHRFPRLFGILAGLEKIRLRTNSVISDIRQNMIG